MPDQITPCFKLLSKFPSSDYPDGAFVGSGCVESSYLEQCVESINSFTDPDLPSVLVLIQYLTQVEGPMRKQIRGIGLSYHYNISLEVSEGLMYFVLFKSTHVVSAYKESIKIIEKHVNDEKEWQESLLESSRSSLVFELIETGGSIPSVSLQSMLSYVRGTDFNYTKDLVTKVAKITLDDLKRVAPKYLTPLFKAETRSVICCHPSKVEEVASEFKLLKKDLKVVNIEEEHFASKF